MATTVNAPKKQNGNGDTHPYEGLAYFRFIPIVAKNMPRALAYTNEVAESVRYLSHPAVIKGAYGVSFGYVAVDTMHRVGQHHTKEGFNETAKYQLGDSLLWHGTASMALPSLTIHTGVKVAKQMSSSLKSPRARAAVPVAVGLGMIPLIIHPIDEGVNYLMNRFVRPHYPEEVREKIIT